MPIGLLQEMPIGLLARNADRVEEIADRAIGYQESADGLRPAVGHRAPVVTMAEVLNPCPQTAPGTGPQSPQW
jgi:hypothetical protein